MRAKIYNFLRSSVSLGLFLNQVGPLSSHGLCIQVTNIFVRCSPVLPDINQYLHTHKHGKWLHTQTETIIISLVRNHLNAYIYRYKSTFFSITGLYKRRIFTYIEASKCLYTQILTTDINH